MREFKLTIPGDPLSKGRPRVYRGHGITDRRTRQAERRVQTEFRHEYPDAKPFEGAVRIGITFWMASRKGRDWDNLAKLATDALNGVAYRDDVQITEATVRKILPDRRVPGAKPGTMRNRRTGDPPLCCGDPYEPRTEITIREINPTI